MILLVIAAELRPQTHLLEAGGAEGTKDTSDFGGSMPKLAEGGFGCLGRYIWLPRAGGADGATDPSSPGFGGLILVGEEGGGLSIFNCSKVFFTMSVILSQLQEPLLRNPYVLSTVIIRLSEFWPQLHAASDGGTCGKLQWSPFSLDLECH